jgi:hypothetical protein
MWSLILASPQYEYVQNGIDFKYTNYIFQIFSKDGALYFTSDTLFKLDISFAYIIVSSAPHLLYLWSI